MTNEKRQSETHAYTKEPGKKRKVFIDDVSERGGKKIEKKKNYVKMISVVKYRTTIVQVHHSFDTRMKVRI